MTQNKQTTLANGLRIASEALPGMQSVALVISVDVGARYETEAENGLSHVLEHMAFKGTNTRSALEIAEAFEDVGASTNAYTSSEQTVYYSRSLPQDLPMAVEIFADILQHSVFAEEELAREREVIVQEIAMQQDSPEDLVLDCFHEAVYTGQPLGRSILGTPERVLGFSASDLRMFMVRHYDPARIIISAAGKVDHTELVALVEHHFHLNPVPDRHQVEVARYIGGSKRVLADFEQMHLMLGFPGLAYEDTDIYAAQLMTTILGGGMSSRLFQEVREKRGLAYSAYAFLSSYADTGLFGVYAAASEEKAASLVPVMCDVLQKMAKDGVSTAELARAKRQHIAGLFMMRESVSGVAETMGKHLLTYGHIKSAQSLAVEYEKVTVEDVRRVLRRLLSPKELTSVALGPQKGLASHEQIMDKLTIHA